jgi:hypothetical protein
MCTALEALLQSPAALLHALTALSYCAAHSSSCRAAALSRGAPAAAVVVLQQHPAHSQLHSAGGRALLALLEGSDSSSNSSNSSGSSGSSGVRQLEQAGLASAVSAAVSLQRSACSFIVPGQLCSKTCVALVLCSCVGQAHRGVVTPLAAVLVL